MVNMEEGQTSHARQDVHDQYVTYQHCCDDIQNMNEGHSSNVRDRGDCGHYMTQ